MNVVRAQKLIRDITVHFGAEYDGKLVLLNTGKYKDRVARIDGCIPDGKYGLLFCCMVLRKNSSEVLNSDGETRQYRPQEEFRFL